MLCKNLSGKVIYVLALFLLTASLPVLGQQGATVTGTVISSRDGSPLAGVTVLIKGTKTAAATDSAGVFKIQAGAGNTLVISYTGFETQELPVKGHSPMRIELAESQAQLGAVVVTALGIESKSKTLSYSTQEVSGKDVNKVPQTNFMNNLSGKVAGAAIYRSAAGVGGSVKVLLRGNKSAQGNNQPLYVINGVPMVNSISTGLNQSFNSTDNGDGISNLNPDDIESISILKGPSAAALYGSQAANGAILITTKKGKAGMSKVEFSSSATIDHIAYQPKLQNSYGQTAAGSIESWGDKIANAADNISGFYKNGNTLTNAVSFSTGAEKSQTYISYANTSARGVLENNKLARNNFSLRQTSKFFDNKLIVDGSITLATQKVNNPPASGFQNNPVYGLYNFPRGLDFDQYKQYQIFDPERNVMTQNWFAISSYNQNPYWMANRILTENHRDRTIFTASAKYMIADGLSFQVRGNMDKTADYNTTKSYLGTAIGYAGVNGGYSQLEMTSTQYYGDALLNLNKSFNKVSVNAVAGTSITDSKLHGISAASTYLYIANLFSIQNMDISNGLNPVQTLSPQHQQLQAVFGSVTGSYNDWLSLSVTGRNDWSSNLSFTPNGSYFYPSFGVSGLLSEALSLPKAISYAKVRGSYAIVGNTVPIFVTNPLNHINNRGEVVFNTTAPFTDLKPEKTRSLELGAELRFLEDKLSLDVTLYKSNTINQFFSISVPAGTGYSERYINGGDIQNKGIEVVAGYSMPATGKFTWNTHVNFTLNRNVVKKLATSVDQFILTNDLNNYYSILKVGGSYGDIYGQVLDRNDKGQLLVTDDGTPAVKSGSPTYLGNPNPRFQLGWNNSFSYKDYSLSLLFDGSFGGKVMSLTGQIMDGMGVSKVTGDARDAGGVKVDGVSSSTGDAVTVIDASKYYHAVGGLQHVTGEYMYSATVVRLRELSLGYSLSKRVLGNGAIRGARLSLVGRNLLYLKRDAPFDPEAMFANGNGYSGLEIFGLPATRSFGLNLNLTF